MRITWIIFLLIAACFQQLFGQGYSAAANAHSHNDYYRPHPFYIAHANRFASIEVDVFLRNGELYVAHAADEIDSTKTLENLYIRPLMHYIDNNGKVYEDGSTLQLLIDLKTEGEPTLRVLEEKLRPYRQYFDLHQNPHAVRMVISGNMPLPERFEAFDSMFFFDGRQGVTYNASQRKRVALISAPFSKFSTWNGLGRIPEPEYVQIKAFIDSVHAAGKKLRFWGNPDTKTCWQAFIKLGVDYINTDNPNELAGFLDTYPKNFYQAQDTYVPYQPDYTSDRSSKKPKNIILLISDGAGFSQLWASATANLGALNIMMFRNVGFLNTSSADDYNTDSAAGGSALSTGSKTRNRYIGVDSAGVPLPNLPDRLAEFGIASAIISNDPITGATPSAFYAHQRERNDSEKIALDILQSKASLFVAGQHPAFEADGKPLKQELEKNNFKVINGLGNLHDSINLLTNRVICFDEDDIEQDYRMIESAFGKSITLLKQSGRGFFIMLEGAKIDGGGHAKDMKLTIEEYLSFDKVVGEALKFADEDGETLVLVTSDHETGGLVLIDGDYKSGKILGHFATNDHTGIPVPVFAYGPKSDKFSGFFQNADLAEIIVEIVSQK